MQLYNNRLYLLYIIVLYMSSKYWFRYTYPPCPDDLNENQKLKKYQILQYNTSTKNGNTKKTDLFSFYLVWK